MYTHTVMRSFMVTKLVKFCQTLFFFLNAMPVALFTSTPGFPAGSFTYNLLSGSKMQRLQHRRRPAWLELLLSLASPGQIGILCIVPLELASFPGEVWLHHPGFTQQEILGGSVATDGERESRRGSGTPVSPTWAGASCLEGPGAPGRHQEEGLFPPSPVICLVTHPMASQRVSQPFHTYSRELL